MDPRKLLRRLARGSVKNVSFDDLIRLVEAFGFERKRISGSHHVYGHPEAPELVNLQEVDGQAKPYQIRQLMKLVERYALKLKEDR
jgi:predicted RNA binding protein YcfA (HicA-like mRNA interferase family)